MRGPPEKSLARGEAMGVERSCQFLLTELVCCTLSVPCDSAGCSARVQSLTIVWACSTRQLRRSAPNGFLALNPSISRTLAR